MANEIASYEIGDRVEMQMDRETRSWGGTGVPDGTIGYIVGYYWMIDYAAHFGHATFSYPVPGIYEKRTGVKVRWPDDTETSAQHCKPVDKEKYDRLRNDRWRPVLDGNYKAGCRILTREQRIGDLPETDLWEGDIVRIKWDDMIVTGCIRSINYHYLYRFCSDQKTLMSDGSLYNFDFCDENGVDLRQGSSSCGTKTATLLKRGNVWKWYNEPENLKDLPLLDEVALHSGLHKYDEVRNPANNVYSWTGTEALQAVRDDLADGFTMSGFLNILPARPSLRRFHDRTLGEKVRAATLIGFEGVTELPELQRA